MKIVLYVLLYSYALVMGATPFILEKSMLSSRLITANALGSLLLLLPPISKWFIISGLISLLIAALLNGIALYGRPNYRHVIIRIIFSCCLFYLYYRISGS